MFGLTTTRRLRRELLVAAALTARLRDERDQARDERDAFKTAARTAARMVADATQPRQSVAGRRLKVSLLKTPARLIEGGHSNTTLSPLTVAAQANARARALEERLATLQTANMRCTCSRDITPHTPRICECGHGHHAHTVPTPHSCFAFGQTCPCKAYRQLPHDKAVAQLERNRQAAAEREWENGGAA
ncbi:hypothetical protein [Streptomyces triticisoli]|uniref:hypothetical protein n=1 Tax=Streptomyces triticisoli TaxID=2182797 RepID=UPI000DD8C5D6|nr:hypothetical protein [Streptomyces triticisoli]